MKRVIMLALCFVMLGFCFEDARSAELIGGAVSSPPIVSGGGFSDVVKKVIPAVVNIVVSVGQKQGGRRGPLSPEPFGIPPGPRGEKPPEMEPSPSPGPRGPEQGAGSGVIIRSDGLIVTNNHVVAGATSMTVMLNDKREFPAKVVGTDPKTDVAVIKIEAQNLPTLKWADYEKIQVGDLVLAVGSPFGLSSTVTLGIISALGRGNVGIADYEDFIQTDAAINPGNSGGALVNVNGDLIGINTAIFSRTGGSEGIGFAIPSSIAFDIVDSLIKTGKVVRGWIGITIQEVTPALAKSFKLSDNKKGVLVSDVNKQGPSYQAGLKRGDVIIAFDDKAVENVNQLRNMVARTIVGRTAKVKVLREGKEQVIALKIAERPSDEVLVRTPSEPIPQPEVYKETFGNVFDSLELVSLTPDMRGKANLPRDAQGVVVTKVEPGSAAEAAGLREGDVIAEIEHTPVASLSEYSAAAKMFGKMEAVAVLIYRNGKPMFIAINPF